MHVLSGWGHRRKSPKPRNLHIRKVSFSGCSLASGCSFESDFSAAPTTASLPSRPTTQHSRTSSNGSFDPLRAHPVKQAPPRLHNRPLIQQSSPQFPEAVTFYDQHDDDVEEAQLEFEEPYQGYSMSIFEEDSDYETDDTQLDLDDEVEYEQREQEEVGEDTDVTEIVPDYFRLPFPNRPALPRSRWSESTIMTLGQLTPAVSNAGTPLAIAEPEVPLPNFSYKRNTVPKRPPIKPVDSVENLLKRGGWKRRGILFDENEVSETEQ